MHASGQWRGKVAYTQRLSDCRSDFHRSTRHALPDDQCKLHSWYASISFHGQTGRQHTMHLNLMTKLHPCHAMPCPNEIRPRDCREWYAKTTERDRSSHGSPSTAPLACWLLSAASISMHACIPKAKTNSRIKACIPKAKTNSRIKAKASRKRSKVACIYAWLLLAWPWLILFNHPKRRQLHATGLLAFFLSLLIAGQNRQEHVYVICLASYYLINTSGSFTWAQLATQRTMTIGEELFSASELCTFLQTVTKTP